ncbi:hypothetical protein PhCBS80983_g05371 [Powellomyces hirtus]|uniref:SH3 domain-containing protein n=1 Tax=Powellomyces hirtus TaxID=109895 RepID=A0A507DWN9_9FUNG|nr:hypothetical protein PhCBS80983_g05371 [Powellomyces hirtus]
MPSRRSLFLAAMVAALCSSTSARYVTLGGQCDDTKGDQFGCEGTVYMTCDPSSKRWISQNICFSACMQIPAFAQNCGRNTHGIEPEGAEPEAQPQPQPPQVPPSATQPPASSRTSPAPSASSALAPPPVPGASSVPAEGIATSTPSNILTPGGPGVGITDPTDRNPSVINGPANDNPNPHANSDSGHSRIPNAVIIAPTLGGAFIIAATAVALVVRKRRQNLNDKFAAGPAASVEAGGGRGSDIRPLFSGIDTGAGLVNVSSVLEKRYVVAHPYQPAADDEIQLNVGDVVRLSLLFNDGWAKGYNETLGTQGLLPCACIAEDAISPANGN